MNKQDVTKFINVAKTAVSKHSPEILTGIGIAGMITTTVLAVKATPKALLLIDNAKYDKGEPLTKVEVVKTAWRPYIPAIATGIASTACLIGASSVSTRRNAALATAYQLSTTALADYKEKVVETIGEKKEQVVRERVAQKQLDEHPVSKTPVLVTNNGKTMCYDVTSGRYFESDIESIKKVINDLNRRMVLGEMYVSLNDLYIELGLPTINIGDELGWTVDTMIEPDFSSQIAEDGRPCVVLEYLVAPRYGFDKLL